jgi:recombination DNA repair RAD52 pathway protein
MTDQTIETTPDEKTEGEVGFTLPSWEPRRLTVEQMGVLMSPIHPSRVATRSVGGANLSYVEAYDIKAMLIRVFGFGGFSSECLDSKILDIRDDGRQGTKLDGSRKTPYVMAQATVRLTIFGIGPDGQDAIYTETAIGTNDGFTIGDVADNAIKSAASDALKRCASFLGSQFGLSLYKKGSKDEVVKAIFAPHQRQVWLDAVGVAPAQQQQAASAHVERALGASAPAEETP